MITTCLFLPKRGNRYVLWCKPSHDGTARRVPVGGRLEDTDSSLFDAAAREAEEESGISPILKESILLGIVETTYIDRTANNRLMIWFTGAFHGTPREYPDEDMTDPRGFTLEQLPLREMWPADACWLPAVLRAHAQNPGTFVYRRRFVYHRGAILYEELLRDPALRLPVFPRT